MRSCGTCTKCCEGWLYAEINDQAIYPGKPCTHLAGNCTIYKKRPETPCKAFVCEWLADTSIPEWMKPDKSQVILIRHKDSVEMIECGQPLHAQPLEWFMTAYITGKYDNITYRIHNHPRSIRSKT